MGDAEPVTAKIVPALAEVDAAAWDACAAPAGRAGSAEAPYNPFITHTFLNTLEESGCVGERTGWLPQHIVIEDGQGGIAACMPCYLKTHSQGEYVFDYGWADAYERAGGRYYPKLQISVPFSPVPGRRLLVRPGTDAPRYRAALAQAAQQLARRYRLSSVHATFLSEEERDTLSAAGWLMRTDRQFHWRNEGYTDFDGFLDSLNARKRKQIRRERRDALAGGIEIDRVTGKELTEDHWDAFFAFYMDTGARKWGQPYLNRTFFSILGDRMADDLLLVMAKREGRYIAGALNLIGSDTLYGRNWGCIEDHPFLHFEVCYYQAIQFVIDRGLRHVEAGAQGEHKLSRGYMPKTTWSAHWIADAGFRDAVARYLKDERSHVAMEERILSAHAPFKKSGG